jgi:hypothetical protein
LSARKGDIAVLWYRDYKLDRLLPRGGRFFYSFCAVRHKCLRTIAVIRRILPF